MTSRRSVALTGALVEALPAPCHGCLFWEAGAPCPQPRTASGDRARRAGDATPVDAGRIKADWVSAQVGSWGPPGHVIQLEGATAAFVLYGPARVFAPRPMTVPAISRDVLFMATAWVDPTERGRGLGRLLVQAALREAIRLELPAVEVYGDRRWQERACQLPATWLLHEGFEVHREHPRTPVLRIDTRRTRRWAESLEHALEELLDRIPRRIPVPVPDRRGVPVPDGAAVRPRRPLTDGRPGT